MLDIKLIRNDRNKIEELLKRKNASIDLKDVCELDEKLRSLKTQLEELQSKRNDYSKKIGELKRKGADATDEMQQVASISEQVHELAPLLSNLEEKFNAAIASLPNLPLEEIPCSDNPADNVVLHTWGKKPAFDFAFKNHVELNEKLNLFDFVRGAKVSGSGWPIYRGIGARLEWALIQMMLNHQIERGFTPFLLPALVKEETVFGSGQLPKFAQQQFKLTDEEFNLYLIPTAEVPLNALHADEIVPQESLPLRYTAYTPCFRREAGAAGAQERGLIRMHQFNKVEMFAFCTPEQSEKIFIEMVESAESILQKLQLHHRRMLLVTGDTSFAAARTVDIEVWLPGQNRYYEVSSISNCTDFQARRSQIRYRPEEGGKPQLVYTLNGSGLATSRLMVAILENNQQPDGSVIIPHALRPYLNNQELLTPP